MQEAIRLPMRKEEMTDRMVRYWKKQGWYVIPTSDLSDSVSDFIILKDGMTVFVDIKYEGRKLYREKLKFKHEIEKHGGVYMYVGTPEEFKMCLAHIYGTQDYSKCYADR